MDYLYEQVGVAQFAEDSVLRRAMRKHLNKVAAALHAIEWNDSGDGDPDGRIDDDGFRCARNG